MNEESQKQELTVWQPSAFEGSDLLPVTAGQQSKALVGRQNIDAEDLILPSLKLLQGSSEEVKKGVENARPGLFWLSGAEEAFLPPIRVLAVSHTKSRALFPKANRPEHAGLEECVSKDGKHGSRYGSCDECPHKEWGENRRRPACSDSHNFTVLTPFGPAILRFQGTSIKAAKKLLSAWTCSSKDLWEHPLAISTGTRTDKVDGRDSTTHLMETKWLQRETVPPHVQAAARALYSQVTDAHAQGRFGSQEPAGEEPPY